MAGGAIDAHKEITEFQQVALEQASCLPAIKNENNELDDKLAKLCIRIKETERKIENLHYEKIKDKAKIEQYEEHIQKLIQKLTEEEGLSSYYIKQLKNFKTEEIEITTNHENVLRELSQAFREVPNRYKENKLQEEIKHSSERLNKVMLELNILKEKIAKMNQIFFYPGENSNYEIIKDMIQSDIENVEKSVYYLSFQKEGIETKIKNLNDEIKEIQYKFGLKPTN